MRIGKLAHELAKTYLNSQARKRTQFLRGKSGIGKSEVVYQLSEVLGKHIENWQGVVDLRLSTMEPVELRGIPHLKEDRTYWAKPWFIMDEGTSGILFLDELTSAPHSMQAAAYQICLEHRIGEHVIPEGWMIIAAGNRQTDRGVTFNMAAPLMNRMTVIDVDTTLDDWMIHAAKNNIRPEILSFLKNRADYLHKFDGKGEIQQFPSPRGWFAASTILDVDYDIESRTELLAGTVGKEAGLSFETHLRVYGQIPDLARIEKDPEGVEIPESLDVRWCLAIGISARLTHKNFSAYWRYLKRLPKELQTLTVKLAYKRTQNTPDNISICSDFTEWALENRQAFSRV